MTDTDLDTRVTTADDGEEEPIWDELGSVLLPSGETLTLRQCGTEFSVAVDEIVLMNSTCHHSEEQLAVLGCAHLTKKSRARVLVGGLGMGFTLRAALDVLPSDAIVDVAELVEEVVVWNRGPMAHLAGEPLQDPRAHVRLGDVQATLASSENVYDAVLLDVDNGPEAFTAATNHDLYSEAGLHSIVRALRPRGVLALWSTGDDGRFTKRLRACGFHVRKRSVPPRPGENFSHLLWIATPT